MKVRLYNGSLKIVEKSGVGQAIHHQQAMLESVDKEVTFRNEKDVDIVHINTVFPDSFCAAIIAKLKGKKVVYYGHSTMEDFRNSFHFSNFLAPLFKQWIKLCYSTGDIIITPTTYSRDLLLSYGFKKPIYALSNGIDTDFFCYQDSYRRAFREKYQIEEGEKVVISVGHYIARKGILDFIELAHSLPEVHFFWFGYTNLNLIPAEIREAIAAAPNNCIFPGYVNREDLRNAYCGCDLFAFMSQEETEGIVVLEALACSCPTLIRDIPVYRDWLVDGENVYKAKDVSSFFSQTVAVLNGTAADLTLKGHATVEERSIHAVGLELLSIYLTMPELEPCSIS